jgi:hypothetical protein
MPSGARVLLRIDGVFEAVLGVFLIGSAVGGGWPALELPVPATRPVMVGVGLLLLPVLPVLWLASRAPRPRMVRLLAAANGVGALLFGLWVVVWHGAFNPAGTALILSVAGILATLAALQARGARTE